MNGNALAYEKAPDALPCPFCGSPDVYTYKYEHHKGAIRYGIMCMGCVASLDPGWVQSPHAVTEMWNKRAQISVHIENAGTLNL